MDCFTFIGCLKYSLIILLSIIPQVTRFTVTGDIVSGMGIKGGLCWTWCTITVEIWRITQTKGAQQPDAAALGNLVLSWYCIDPNWISCDPEIFLVCGFKPEQSLSKTNFITIFREDVKRIWLPGVCTAAARFNKVQLYNKVHFRLNNKLELNNIEGVKWVFFMSPIEELYRTLRTAVLCSCLCGGRELFVHKWRRNWHIGASQPVHVDLNKQPRGENSHS